MGCEMSRKIAFRQHIRRLNNLVLCEQQMEILNFATRKQVNYIVINQMFSGNQNLFFTKNNSARPPLIKIRCCCETNKAVSLPCAPMRKHTGALRLLRGKDRLTKQHQWLGPMIQRQYHISRCQIFDQMRAIFSSNQCTAGKTGRTKCADRKFRAGGYKGRVSRCCIL